MIIKITKPNFLAEYLIAFTNKYKIIAMFVLEILILFIDNKLTQSLRSAYC